MMPPTTAIANAKQVNELGFPEFTTKLVLDVFNGLMAAHVRQTEMYSEALAATTGSLAKYIGDTTDDIDGEMILAFLRVAVESNSNETGTAVGAGLSLTPAQHSSLKAAVRVEGAELAADNQLPGLEEGTPLTEISYGQILLAVARRIAASRFELLRLLVRQGMLRLVVTEGMISTGVTFAVDANSFAESKSSKFERDDFKVRVSAKTGSKINVWVKASASASKARLLVRSSSSTANSSESADVEFLGRVELRFKTDYAPLASDT